VRRRLREGVRERLAHILPGYDVVLIARAGAAEAAYHELTEAMATLFDRAGLSGGAQ
jgi:ribonuclease P protein component